MEKIITVFGATGAQGGAVVQALLDEKKFKVRGVTRNVDSSKAKSLKEKGVEMVKADIDDAVSVASALEGTYGVFLVTNFWEYMNKEREIKQGKIVADAAKKAGVQHFVYSGLEKVNELIGRECPHFDGKGVVEDYLQEIDLPNTSVRYGMYYHVLVDPNMFAPRKQEDGTYLVVSATQGPVYIVDPADGGPAVASIFNQPKEFIGKKVGLAGDHISMEEIVDLIGKTFNKTVSYQQVPVDVYAAFKFPGAENIAAMFEYYNRHTLVRDIDLTKKLNPKTKNFQEWLEANKTTISF